MRAYSGFRVCVGVAVIALIVACGRVQREEGCLRGAPSSTGFCDDGSGPSSEPPNPFGPGPMPSTCSTHSYAIESSGAICSDHPRGSRRAPGSSCVSSTDCASVCCVLGANGHWVPSEEADAGEDASADEDADADASANASEDASADADAGSRARRVWACGCGTCLSPRETCATADVPHGLGGP
jgi:hypothetical protein